MKPRKKPIAPRILTREFTQLLATKFVDRTHVFRFSCNCRKKSAIISPQTMEDWLFGNPNLMGRPSKNYGPRMEFCNDCETWVEWEWCWFMGTIRNDEARIEGDRIKSFEKLQFLQDISQFFEPSLWFSCRCGRVEIASKNLELLNLAVCEERLKCHLKNCGSYLRFKGYLAIKRGS